MDLIYTRTDALTETQRPTCSQHGHVRETEYKKLLHVCCLLSAVRGLVCHFRRVCVCISLCVCVFAVGVKGHCVGGHRVLCVRNAVGCCFEAGRDRTSGKGWKQSKHQPAVGGRLPQLGPCMDTHTSTHPVFLP